MPRRGATRRGPPAGEFASRAVARWMGNRRAAGCVRASRLHDPLWSRDKIGGARRGSKGQRRWVGDVVLASNFRAALLECDCSIRCLATRPIDDASGGFRLRCPVSRSGVVRIATELPLGTRFRYYGALPSGPILAEWDACARTSELFSHSRACSRATPPGSSLQRLDKLTRAAHDSNTRAHVSEPVAYARNYRRDRPGLVRVPPREAGPRRGELLVSVRPTSLRRTRVLAVPIQASLAPQRHLRVRLFQPSSDQPSSDHVPMSRVAPTCYTFDRNQNGRRGSWTRGGGKGWARQILLTGDPAPQLGKTP